MTRSDVKVGDKVRSTVYGNGVIEDDGHYLVGVRFDSGSYRAYRKDDCSSTLEDKDSIELIPDIKVGDTVTLIDDFYNHEAFKSEPRDQRKDIARLKGRAFKFLRLSILNDRAQHDTDCPWSIPIELLRKVDDGVIKGMAEPKKGDLFRVIGNDGHHHHSVGDIVEFKSESSYQSYYTYCPATNKSQFVHKTDLEPYDGIHRHTPDQIAEAQRIIGEIVAGFQEGQCFFLFDESDKEIAIWYSAETSYIFHTSIAHCSPHDEFNRTIGVMVALCKAVGRKLPDWL